MTATYDMTFGQGEDVSYSLALKDGGGSAMVLDGYSARSQIRRNGGSALAAAFTVSVASATGVVTLTLSASTTSAMSAGVYRYDVELASPSGKVSRILVGSVTVSEEITK